MIRLRAIYEVAGQTRLSTEPIRQGEAIFLLIDKKKHIKNTLQQKHE